MINRYDTKKEGFSVGHLQRLLQTPQLVTIANDYPGVTPPSTKASPCGEKSPRSPVLADINKLTRMSVSVGTVDAPPPRKRSSLSRLVHAIFGSNL